MNLGRRGRSSVRVYLFVVVMREVVECLEGLRSVGVVEDAILAGTEQVLECVDRGFVVLLA